MNPLQRFVHGVAVLQFGARCLRETQDAQHKEGLRAAVRKVEEVADVCGAELECFEPVVQQGLHAGVL